MTSPLIARRSRDDVVGASRLVRTVSPCVQMLLSPPVMPRLASCRRRGDRRRADQRDSRRPPKSWSRRSMPPTMSMSRPIDARRAFALTDGEAVPGIVDREAVEPGLSRRARSR